MDEDRSTAEDIWRRKTDAEVTAAAARLDEYTEEGRQIIRNEVDRRHSGRQEEKWPKGVGSDRRSIARPGRSRKQ